MLKTLKIILIVIFGFVALFLLILSYFSLIRMNDIRLQNRHLRRLADYYALEHVPEDESTWIDFDVSDPTLTLHDIRLLATHNSYKKTGPALGRLFVGLGENFDEARSLRYGYQTLTAQFENGIRSMEWDVRLRNGQFEITHVPLVDNSGIAPVLEPALQELRLFSEHHPDHIPIIILFEIKYDWMVLDPLLENIGTDELLALDLLLEDVLGQHLFRPSDLFDGNVTSLRETIQNDGWPSVHSLLGKVIIVLHPGRPTQPYVDLDPSLMSQAMFPGVHASGTSDDHAAFVVHNSVDIEAIGNLVDEGFIVRTRIDSGLVFNQQRFDDALASGAQILTSDFTIGRSDLDPALMITLPGNKTVIRRD
ncbi:MAG: hypothetical protein EA375_02880 [Acholeplasmataceae bacterium]|nr:MAG: hypothetical protein EA375_02880 [Acholeplasmataceae bacterium]